MKRIQQWSEKLWRNSAKKWIKREQDLNYRNLLVWPNFEKILSRLPVCRNGFFVDLGCGDGSETLKLQHLLNKKGFSGTLLGIDRQKTFIDFAQRSISSDTGVSLSFKQTLVAESSPLFISRKADLIFSMFVLQDIACAEMFLRVVKSSLKKSGVGIFVLVHPEFGEAMKKKGALNQVRCNDSTKDLIWTAEYPIVEEWGTFYVPYFHRSLATYKKFFAKFFNNQQYLELMPDEKLTERGEQNRLLPFCKHPNNVYYPEIMDMPSSLIVVVSIP